MRDSATYQDVSVSNDSDSASITVLPRGITPSGIVTPSSQVVTPPVNRARQTVVASVIEAQIIPRLLASSLPAAPLRVRPKATAIAPHDVAEFTELILSGNDMALTSYIDLFRAKGILVETIYLDLLTGAARQLGSLWGADECNFCEVSIASWKIQKLMYELRPAFFAEGSSKMPSGYRVLFAPIASEQHTLGTMMAAEFFRRAGWDVSSVLPTDNQELLDTVANEHIDLVGISISSESMLHTLASSITAIKAASLNRHITVMVGGWIFNHNSTLASQHGADFSTPDIRDAILQAEKHVSRAWGVSTQSNNKTRSPITNHQNATY